MWTREGDVGSREARGSVTAIKMGEDEDMDRGKRLNFGNATEAEGAEFGHSLNI